MQIVQIAIFAVLLVIARMSAQDATKPAAPQIEKSQEPKPIDAKSAHELSQMQTELYRLEAEYRGLNSQLLELQTAAYKKLTELMTAKKEEFDKAAELYRARLGELKKKSGARDACDIDLKQAWKCPPPETPKPAAK